jgi:hypothetical protein
VGAACVLVPGLPPHFTCIRWVTETGNGVHRWAFFGARASSRILACREQRGGRRKLFSGVIFCLFLGTFLYPSLYLPWTHR